MRAALSHIKEGGHEGGSLTHTSRRADMRRLSHANIKEGVQETALSHKHQGGGHETALSRKHQGGGP